jgi:hypothetical protein
MLTFGILNGDVYLIIAESYEACVYYYIEILEYFTHLPKDVTESCFNSKQNR